MKKHPLLILSETVDQYERNNSYSRNSIILTIYDLKDIVNKALSKVESENTDIEICPDPNE